MIVFFFQQAFRSRTSPLMIVFFFQLAFRFGRHPLMIIFFSASFQIWEKSSHDCIFFFS